MIPVVDEAQKQHIEAVKDLIMNEVNVKEIKFVELANVPSRIDAFLDVISNFEIAEMCRSGVTAIRK